MFHIIQNKWVKTTIYLYTSSVLESGEHKMVFETE